MNPIHFVQHHTYTALIILWVMSNAASTLPAPKPSGGELYKWFFGFMHATFGMVPRLIATMFPAVAQFIGISTIQGQGSRVASFAASAETDMNNALNTAVQQSPDANITAQAKIEVKAVPQKLE